VEALCGYALYLGKSLISVRSDNADNAPVPPDVGLRTTLTALGFRVNRDTRPNRFYPTDGMLIDFTSDFFTQGWAASIHFKVTSSPSTSTLALAKGRFSLTTFSRVAREGSLPSTETASTARTTNYGDTSPDGILTGTWSQRRLSTA